MSLKRLMVLLLVAVLGVSSLLLGGCKTKTSLDIRGSDTLINVGGAWAEKFMADNPKYTVAVQGGGSGTGANALINKNCDIAQMSRAMKDSEKKSLKDATGKDAKEFIVGYDGVAMVVSNDNPIDELSIAQLARMFRGEVTNWSEFGGPDAEIVALARDTSSGTHVFVKEHVVQEQGAKGDAEYGGNVQFLTSNQAIHDEVKGNDQAIGYIGLGYLDTEVKAIRVRLDDDSPAVAPSVETVADKSYTVSRPLFNYTAGDPQGLAKTYLDFVMSAQGQQIVADLGFVPVK